MTERKDDRLWGGRFEREPNAQFDAFQRSFAFDRRLLAYEIAVDRAWAKALEPIGIFTAAEVRQTRSEERRVGKECRSAKSNDHKQKNESYGFRCCHTKNSWTAPTPPETELS